MNDRTFGVLLCFGVAAVVGVGFWADDRWGSGPQRRALRELVRQAEELQRNVKRLDEAVRELSPVRAVFKVSFDGTNYVPVSVPVESHFVGPPTNQIWIRR